MNGLKVFITGVCFFIYFSFSSLAYACSLDSLFVKSNDVITEIYVEVADTPQSRKQGLMYRDQLAPLSGMFFIFDKPQKVQFWMKNTSISLDMIFINRNGVVEKVIERTIPYSQNLIYGGSDIQYVLELPSGLSKELNIRSGTEVIHPLIKSKSIWFCENLK